MRAGGFLGGHHAGWLALKVYARGALDHAHQVTGVVAVGAKGGRSHLVLDPCAQQVLMDFVFERLARAKRFREQCAYSLYCFSLSSGAHRVWPPARASDVPQWLRSSAASGNR